MSTFHKKQKQHEWKGNPIMVIFLPIKQQDTWESCRKLNEKAFRSVHFEYLLTVTTYNFKKDFKPWSWEQAVFHKVKMTGFLSPGISLETRNHCAGSWTRSGLLFLEPQGRLTEPQVLFQVSQLRCILLFLFFFVSEKGDGRLKSGDFNYDSAQYIHLCLF